MPPAWRPRGPAGAPAALRVHGRPAGLQGRRNARLGRSAPAPVDSARSPDPPACGRAERTGAARPEAASAPERPGVRCAPRRARPRGLGARRPGPPPATWTGPDAGRPVTRIRARSARSATRTRMRAHRSSSPGRDGAGAERSRPWSWPMPDAGSPQDALKERDREPKPPDAKPARRRPARGGRADAAGPWHPLALSPAPAASAHPKARSPNRRRVTAAAIRTTSPRRRRRPSPCRPGGRPARPEGWSDPATRDASGVAQAANGPGCLAWIRRARGGTRARGGFRLGVGGSGDAITVTLDHCRGHGSVKRNPSVAGSPRRSRVACHRATDHAEDPARRAPSPAGVSRPARPRRAAAPRARRTATARPRAAAGRSRGRRRVRRRARPPRARSAHRRRDPRG